MYRYRKMDGRSRTVLDSFNRHRAKLGTITRITGSRFWATRGTGDSQFTTDFEVVRIYGTDGSMRLDGVCWGYGGTGPCTLRDLLQAAGISKDDAERVAFETPRSCDPLHPETLITREALAALPTRNTNDWTITL